jgi:beta-galactosidase/beta-glucuronidase
MGTTDPTEHPRPLLRRPWTSLDGEWEFAADPDRAGTVGGVAFDRRIRVPYAPETPAGGVAWTGPLRRVWYRRPLPAPGGDRRTLLHFGAVDRVCDVWVGGAHVAHHEGGYTPFAVDVTDALGDGGFDDRWGLLWEPGNGRLLDAEVALVADDGEVLDEVESYTALRSVGVEDGQFLVNDRPTRLRLVLDQGYWPDTGATPPDVAALRRDLELTRALGFTGVRKHQKTEDPRFLALADRMGLLVWAEMPSAHRPGPTAAARLLREWPEVVAAHRGHPSVVAWVPLNESWGVQEAEADARQRALIGALAAAAGALDGTRPVSANDGWETLGGDVLGVHDYTQVPAQLAARYRTREDLERVATTRRPDGRLADLDRAGTAGRAVVLSEFGGVALRDPDEDDRGWGYAEAHSPEDLLARYRGQWAAVHSSEALAGACWTQLTDTYQEVNGLLTMHRVPKCDPDDLRRATLGEA